MDMVMDTGTNMDMDMDYPVTNNLNGVIIAQGNEDKRFLEMCKRAANWVIDIEYTTRCASFKCRFDFSRCRIKTKRDLQALTVILLVRMSSFKRHIRLLA